MKTLLIILGLAAVNLALAMAIGKRLRAMSVPAVVVPLWPSRGFWDFCRCEIRKGLMIRYVITLPAMWRREQAFRREITACLNNGSTGQEPA